jgi:hypothetical protein
MVMGEGESIMLSEQQLLELRCRLEKYITEREAMIAFNKYREMRGETLGYDDRSFFDLYDKIEELEKCIGEKDKP